MIGKYWDAEHRAHSDKVAAAHDRMLALRPAVAGAVSWAGHLPQAIETPGNPEFNAAVAAYETAMDERDAFLEDRRANDVTWRER